MWASVILKISMTMLVESRCSPPTFDDSFIQLNCSEELTYGSKCNLRCFANFPLVGNDTIVCEKNSTSDQTKMYWDKGDFEPYCQRKTVYDLVLHFFLNVGSS